MTNCQMFLPVVAFLFNWIGFCLSFCLTNTIAGRYGAICGFGLSLIKWILIVRVCSAEFVARSTQCENYPLTKVGNNQVLNIQNRIKGS